MKDVYMRELVRKAVLRDGKSQRAVSRELGLSRNTIRRIVAEPTGECPRYQLSAPKPRPVLGEYVEQIETWLKQDETAPKKQRHTARRIFERLKSEYGFEGSERSVRKLVAQLREKPKEVFVPLRFEPGEMAQVDWGQVKAVIAGELRTLHLFVLTLNYSGAFYLEAFERETQEAFFQGHRHAFEWLGGVPVSITYDNLKAAVSQVFQGKKRKENEGFVAFRSSYLFDSVFCNPARGNEKGRVENMVKYAERNAFTPVPETESIPALNEELLSFCQLYLEQTQARQNESVGARLEQEQAKLLPLPKFHPDCCRVVSVKADKSALVQFETNRYSVPCEYAHQHVWLKAFVDKVVITTQSQMIAEHPRLTGRYEESLLQAHYEKVLERKPLARDYLRAIASEKPVENKPAELEPLRFPQVYVQPPNLSCYRVWNEKKALP